MISAAYKVTLGVAALSCLAPFPFLNEAYAQDEPIGRILRAWEKRQAEVKSFRFAWVERQTYAKGSLLNPDMHPKLNPARLTLPPEDMTFDAPFKSIFDGARMRYSYEGKVWKSETGECFDQKYDSVFDGQRGKDLWPLSVGGYPRGHVRHENTIIKNIHLRPIVAAYRPLDPNTGVFGTFAPGGFRILSENGEIRGHRCVVIEEVTKSPDQEKRTLWIDPSRALILRCLIGTQRETCYQINVAYQEDSRHGWVPSRWEIIKKVDPLDPDKVCETDSASVTAYAINGPVSQEDFSLEFPPGTWVMEEVEPPPSTKTIDYITRKGGGQEADYPRRYWRDLRAARQ